VLIEQNDEWLTGHRYVSDASMAELLAQLGNSNEKKKLRRERRRHN